MENTDPSMKYQVQWFSFHMYYSCLHSYLSTRILQKLSRSFLILAIPPPDTWKMDPEAEYVYYCANETINGKPMCWNKHTSYNMLHFHIVYCCINSIGVGQGRGCGWQVFFLPPQIVMHLYRTFSFEVRIFWHKVLKKNYQTICYEWYLNSLSRQTDMKNKDKLMLRIFHLISACNW